MGAAAGKRKTPRNGKTWCDPVQEVSIKSELAETKVIPSTTTVARKCEIKPLVRTHDVLHNRSNSRPVRSTRALKNKIMQCSQENNAMNTTRSVCSEREHERPPLTSSGSAGSFCRSTIQDSRPAVKKRLEDIPVSRMWREQCVGEITHTKVVTHASNAQKESLSVQRKPMGMDESILKDIDEIESNYMAGQKAMQTHPWSYHNRVKALAMEAQKASSVQSGLDFGPSDNAKGPPARTASDTGGDNSGFTGTASANQQPSGVCRRPATPAEPTWLKPRHLSDYFEKRRFGECGSRGSTPPSSYGGDRRWMQTIPDGEESSDSRSGQPFPRRRARKDVEFPSFFTF